MSNFNFNKVLSQGYNKWFNLVQSRAVMKATAKLQAASNYPNPMYNSGHNIHMAVFEDTIYDYLNRRLSTFNVIPSYQATGPSHLWFEQTKIPQNVQFSNPRNLEYKPTDDDYGREPRSAIIKCMTSKFSVPFFDTLAARQQGELPDFVTKDLQDWLWAFDRFINEKLLFGSDTSLETPTTNEYVGITKQITNRPVREKTETRTITDVIETEIANMESDTVNVTSNDASLVLLMNSKTQDLWVKQERARTNNTFRVERNEFRPGFNIPYITTAKGDIPIITENYLPTVDNNSDGTNDHTILLVDRSKIERRYIGSPTPMVFPWNMGNDQLSDDKLAVLFDTVIVRNAGKAHFNLTFKQAK